MSMAILVRHGETFNNRDLRFQGFNDGPDAQLTPKGREQARAVRDVVKRMPFDVVWASPLGRARETAEIIVQGRNLPILFDDRLREVDFGELNGLSLKDYFVGRGRSKTDWWADNWDVPYPGGESFEQLYARVADFAAMCRERTESTMLIVSHSTPLKMSLALMENRDPKELLPLYVPNCGAYRADKVAGELWKWRPIHPPEAVEGFIT